MEIVSGRSMMDQIAFGRLRFFHRDIPEVTRFSQLPWQEEEARFRLAQRRAVLHLAAFHDQVSRQTEPNTASIFAIHAMLLEDDDFVNSILTLIRQEKVTAEYAVQAVGQNFRATFSAMDSSYMRARAADIRDISRRVMRLLMNCHPKDYLQQGPAILVSDEFFPSEVMDLNHRRLLGLGRGRHKGQIALPAGLFCRMIHTVTPPVPVCPARQGIMYRQKKARRPGEVCGPGPAYL